MVLPSRLSALPRRARSALSSLARQHQAESDVSVLPRARAWSHAFGTVWRDRADILSFLRTGDAALAHDLRRRFGLGALSGAAHPIPNTLFSPVPPPPVRAPATILIPIFNAAEHLAILLEHLPGTLPDGQPVLLVDDGSTDPRIGALITRFARQWAWTQTLNMPQNEGFVAAVNSGLAHVQPDHHVILLNSDTLPPVDWVPRLLAPLLETADIASVTPLSNAAEILSVPGAGLDAAPDRGLIAGMDGVARRLCRRTVEVPTGIGFCIALNRGFLKRIGGFDPAFGRGYGEEVDWCRKASAHGGRHVVATNLVVGHSGSASFGTRARQARIAQSGRIIEARYPGYAKAALAWERRDPIAPERLAVTMAWVAHRAGGDDVPVYIAHALGGGAETALQAEIVEGRRAGTETAVILRVGGPSAWRVELCGDRFSLVGDVADPEVMHALLAPLTRRHVVYSCAVQGSDPGAVPGALLRLAEGQRLSVRLHDFFPISPSWNLLDADGRYRGVPPRDTRDPAHAAAGSETVVPHRDWRDRWGRVMSVADEITVFSASSAALLREAYHEAEGRIVLRPHRVPTVPPRLAPGGRTLGVLGGINHAKGGTVLQTLAHTGFRRIAIIGELDGCFRLPAPHVVHGRYAPGEIARLARRYDVGAWFQPSICPETFSFATHETLATGLPVACFDLGAQAEAVAAAPNGYVLPLDPDDTPCIAELLERLFEG